MDDLKEKANHVIKDKHFTHALALGAVAFAITKYMETGKPTGPPPQIVQIAAKPRNTKLLVTLGIIGASYYYMSVYGHNVPTKN